uniref:RING-type domain-containing protein n=1 Tax=Kalanchoe fedtschenkoi TaxID=63787 RepID=A0A7N0R895_KALFE
MMEGGAVGSVICSICYEDLKPAVEHLQAISVCGHVFHELCLQQWFEYCSNKKSSCPVCKQTCTQNQAGRLYFQSVGDHNDIDLFQKTHGAHQCPELQSQVKRLELKVSALTSTLEHQQKSLKDINEELCSCKDLAKKEAALKVEAVQQRQLLQQSLQCKSEDLDRSLATCSRLQERNMALAKELATIKLVTDLDLNEDEALKLASLSCGGNHKDTVDILRKSLVIRNKSYKELMVKCNLLGRGEARSNMKLEKAKERISKLQTRVQQLETAIEIKSNEGMRVLKSSEKSPRMMDTLSPSLLISTSPKKKNLFGTPGEDFYGKQTGALADFLSSVKDTNSSSKGKGSYITIDDNNSIGATDGKEKSGQSRLSSMSQETSCQANEVLLLDSVNYFKKDVCTSAANCSNEVTTVLFDDIAQVQSSLHIRNETSSSAVLPESTSEELFSGGLLGPDGLNRSLGKWCKKGQKMESGSLSIGLQGGTKAVTGRLIAVGADGRGGKVKVLRSLHESLDNMGKSARVKRQKQGTKTSSSLQSRGCLQIEHFFGKSV